MLLLDNRDSFVWNLAQALAMLGQDVVVERSDAVSLADVERRLRLGALRGIVMSPGPGRPEDAGVCVPLVRALSGRVPLLGICLGHQAICAAFAAEIARTSPCHGKTSSIAHSGEGLFRGLPARFAACRYHSLAVRPATLPETLVADAWTADGVVMAVRHRQHPTYGLQFHPESFRTEHGQTLMHNFLEQTRGYHQESGG